MRYLGYFWIIKKYLEGSVLCPLPMRKGWWKNFIKIFFYILKYENILLILFYNSGPLKRVMVKILTIWNIKTKFFHTIFRKKVKKNHHLYVMIYPSVWVHLVQHHLLYIYVHILWSQILGRAKSPLLWSRREPAS